MSKEKQSQTIQPLNLSLTTPASNIKSELAQFKNDMDQFKEESAEFKKNLTLNGKKLENIRKELENLRRDRSLRQGALQNIEQNPSEEPYSTLLENMIRRNNIQELKEAHASQTPSERDQQREVKIAIEYGWPNILSWLLTPKANGGFGISLSPYNCELALKLAIEKSKFDTVKLLFMPKTRGGLGIPISPYNHELALNLASEKGQFDMLKLLFLPETQGGFGVSLSLHDRELELTQLIEKGLMNVVKFILTAETPGRHGLSHAANYQVSVERDIPLLMTAIKHHQYDIADWLLMPTDNGGYGLCISLFHLKEALKLAMEQGQPQMAELLYSRCPVGQKLGQSCSEAIEAAMKENRHLVAKQRRTPQADEEAAELGTPGSAEQDPQLPNNAYQPPNQLEEKHSDTSYSKLGQMILRERQNRTKQVAANRQQRGLAEFNEAKQEFETSLQASLNSLSPKDVEELEGVYRKMKLRHEVKADVFFNRNSALGTLHKTLTGVKNKFPTLKLEKLLHYYGELNPKLRYALELGDQGLFAKVYEEYIAEKLAIEECYQVLYRGRNKSSDYNPKSETVETEMTEIKAQNASKGQGQALPDIQPHDQFRDNEPVVQRGSFFFTPTDPRALPAPAAPLAIPPEIHALHEL